MTPSIQSQRLLVREVNWLGDLVISLPALWAVRRAWPEAHLAVMVRDHIASFFDGAEGTLVDEVIPFRFPRGFPGLRARWRFGRDVLKSLNFDLTILFPNSFDSALVARFGAIPRRVGYNRDARGLLLTKRVSVTEEIRARHQVHYYLNLVGTLGAEGAPEDCILPVSVGALERADRMLEGALPHRVALAPGAAFGPAKAWMPERYAWLADRFADDGWTPVFVGAPGNDAEVSARITGELMKQGDRAVNTAGKTSVAELIALLSRCGAFIGNDSGAMHVAGALGLPALGLFGSSEPDRTAPLGPRAETLTRRVACSPCFLRECPRALPEHMCCFRTIEVDEVFETVNRMVSR